MWFQEMEMPRSYCIYILTNQGNTTLYTGVTNDLRRRIFEHRTGAVEGFTKKYRLVKLVYYEIADSIQAAILREKQIKAGSRKKKVDLIDRFNPEWKDLWEEI